jgi:malate/lactate dehydrogenase
MAFGVAEQKIYGKRMDMEPMLELRQSTQQERSQPHEKLSDLAAILAAGVLRLQARRRMSNAEKNARREAGNVSEYSPNKDLISTPERSVHAGGNEAERRLS